MKPNPRFRPSDADAIEARAAAWLAQRDQGFSPEDAEAFSDWVKQDLRHEAAVERLENAWAQLQQLREYRPAARIHPDPDLLAPPRRSRVRSFPSKALAWAAAAVIALAVLGTWVRHPRMLHAPAAVAYETTRGGFQRVSLPDGSVAELNAETAITVNYSATERRVTLSHGEAHFTVARNEQRPFWVEAGGVTVRAVGTAFDVRLAAEELEVLVTAGTVQLGRATGASGSRSLETPLLNAGWRALIPSSPEQKPVVEKVSHELARARLAWQSSRLVFADLPLAEVIQEFNLRNPVQISLADPSLGALPIAGSFEADNVEAFVRLLSTNGDLAFDQKTPEQIVIRKTR